MRRNAASVLFRSRCSRGDGLVVVGVGAAGRVVGGRQAADLPKQVLDIFALGAAHGLTRSGFFLKEKLQQQYALPRPAHTTVGRPGHPAEVRLQNSNLGPAQRALPDQRQAQDLQHQDARRRRQESRHSVALQHVPRRDDAVLYSEHPQHHLLQHLFSHATSATAPPFYTHTCVFPG